MADVGCRIADVKAKRRKASDGEPGQERGIGERGMLRRSRPAFVLARIAASWRSALRVHPGDGTGGCERRYREVMRIPGSKVYRAFPELDHFSDDQCRKFVRAANRGFWWTSLRIFVWVSGAISILAVAAIGLSFLTGAWKNWLGDSVVEFVGDLSPWLAAALLFPLAALVLRDWLLIRLVRSILRTRGCCSRCSYGLLGLPVDADLSVTCPECGARTKVDPSLGELTKDAQGNTRFQPSADSLVVRRFWTPKRKKWAIRIGVAAILVFVVLPLTALAIREGLMQLDASKARADRVRIQAEWAALIEEGQPQGTSNGDADAWAFEQSISKKHERIFKDLMAIDPKRNPDGDVPMVDLIYRPPVPPGPDDPGGSLFPPALERYKRDLKSRELGLEFLKEMREAGTFEDLDRMCRARRALPNFVIDPNRPLVELFLPELGQCRALFRLNAARMYLARQSGDVNEYVRAAEANFALIRMVRCGPTVIHQLVASALQVGTFDQCNGYFADGAPPDLAGRLRAALARQYSVASYPYGIRGDGLMVMDTIAWLFEKPSRVRLGMRSSAVKELLGKLASITPMSESWVGWYGDNKNVLDEFFAETMTNAKKETWQRSAKTVDTSRYPLIDRFLAPFSSILSTQDGDLAIARGFELVLRIEEFRTEHGSIPSSLDALGIGAGSEVARDPYSGKPFGYFVIDDAGKGELAKSWPDKESRDQLIHQGYLLIAAGPDGKLDFQSWRDSPSLVPGWEASNVSGQPGKDLLLTPLQQKR